MFFILAVFVPSSSANSFMRVSVYRAISHSACISPSPGYLNKLNPLQSKLLWNGTASTKLIFQNISNFWISKAVIKWQEFRKSQCKALHFPPDATQPIVRVYFIALYRALASLRTRLLDHKQRRATFGRTPLNEWSVRRRDLYLTTHNTRNRQTSMPRVGFEPTIPAGERP